jgi:hypothetical protein
LKMFFFVNLFDFVRIYSYVSSNFSIEELQIYDRYYHTFE